MFKTIDPSTSHRSPWRVEGRGQPVLCLRHVEYSMRPVDQVFGPVLNKNWWVHVHQMGWYVVSFVQWTSRCVILIGLKFNHQTLVLRKRCGNLFHILWTRYWAGRNDVMLIINHIWGVTTGQNVASTSHHYNMYPSNQSACQIDRPHGLTSRRDYNERLQL